jgi:hypothetical protein
MNDSNKLAYTLLDMCTLVLAQGRSPLYDEVSSLRLKFAGSADGHLFDADLHDELEDLVIKYMSEGGE